MPTWLPIANVFSAGDVLIGIGVAIAIVAGMHGRGPRLDVVPTTPADPIGAPGH
jgi:hypothetical protein